MCACVHGYHAIYHFPNLKLQNRKQKRQKKHLLWPGPHWAWGWSVAETGSFYLPITLSPTSANDFCPPLLPHGWSGGDAQQWCTWYRPGQGGMLLLPIVMGWRLSEFAQSDPFLQFPKESFSGSPTQNSHNLPPLDSPGSLTVLE